MKSLENTVRDVLNEIISDDVVVGVSNRHVHLSQEDLEKLFGKGYELTKMKPMKQPGQFAAEETVTIEGVKGSIEGVRILGPVRKETQIEISITDSFKLGIKPPIRQSGKLEDTPGIKIIGPRGEIIKERGVIIAGRHIHMPKFIADIRGYKDGEIVKVGTSGERKTVLYNVLLRVGENMAKEIHIDMDEANATGLKNNEYVKIIKD